MSDIIDNRIYIWSKEQDVIKALELKNDMIENNFDKILDIRILQPEHDVVMQLAYDVHIYPTIIILNNRNDELNRYSGSFEKLKNKIINKEIEMV